MKRRRILQALATLPWLPMAHPARSEPAAPRVLGYLPWWMAPSWPAMALDKLDRLVLFDAPNNNLG